MVDKIKVEQPRSRTKLEPTTFLRQSGALPLHPDPEPVPYSYTFKLQPTDTMCRPFSVYNLFRTILNKYLELHSERT